MRFISETRLWVWASIRLNILLIRLRLRKPRTSPFISMWPAYTIDGAWFAEYDRKVKAYLATNAGRAYSRMVLEHEAWLASHVTMGTRGPNGELIPGTPKPRPPHDRAACTICVTGREESLAAKVGMA